MHVELSRMREPSPIRPIITSTPLSFTAAGNRGDTSLASAELLAALEVQEGEQPKRKGPQVEKAALHNKIYISKVYINNFHN